MIGTTIAHYRIVAKLGEGGMGEVYRATDTRLNREVALKILPEQFAADSGRMARFQREAEVLASLDHPNIGAIHGIEDVGPTKALVLQLIEGPTLADRIAQGPIPVDEALPIALQVAGALEAAHEKGIVHRDLKPANIKITPEGRVKVLDFGLAKAPEPDSESSSSDLTRSPTLTVAATEAGVILGTAAYMAPEQARGRSVDRRADIWAFGAVLYEMLSGQRAFPGDDLAAILARVIEREPDWSALPGTLSPALNTFLRRCLEKDPGQRLQAIGDMRLAIEGRFDLGEDTASTSPARSTALPWTVALAATTIAVALGLWGNRNNAEAPELVPDRFSIQTAAGTTFPRGIGGVVAVSPDSRTIVYVGNGPEGRQLFRRRLSEETAVPIPGTEGATHPVFSPDGQSLAFSDDTITEIKRVPVTGGDPFTICSLCIIPFWGDDDTIIYEWEGSLFRVDAAGGEPSAVVPLMPERGVAAMSRARFLPGATAVLFQIGHFSDFGGVAVYSLETEELTVLTDNGSSPVYSRSGHILFAREGTLLAVPFDVAELRVTGPAVPVLSGVRVENGGHAQFAVSPAGLLVYVPATVDAGSELVWVDTDGQFEPVIEERRNFYAPRISPDGEKIAVQINAGGRSDVWLYQSGTLRPLTNTGRAANPIWRPDSRTVTFSSRLDGSFAIESLPIDDRGKASTVLSGDSLMAPQAWTPDGTRLIFLAGGSDLLVTDVRDPGSRAPLAASDFSDHSAALSPSGAWVAYTSDQTGTREVYLRPFPGPGPEQAVSRGGGSQPSWGRSDSELMFRSPNSRQLYRVELRFEPLTFQQNTLFASDRYWIGMTRAQYDVHPDGTRLLMLDQISSEAGLPLRVVTNWFTELKRLAPGSPG